jgi:hypothetical protein
VRSEHNRLLSEQQSGQHRAAAALKVTGEVGRQNRQRARQDVRQDQVMTRIADHAVTITSCCADFHEVCDAIAPGIVAGNGHSAGIDIGREHLAA